MTYTEKDIKLIEEFQNFADSILWSNDDGSEKYIGVGNMADWWLPKIHQAKQEGYEIGKEEGKLVQKMYEHDPFRNKDSAWNQAWEKGQQEILERVVGEIKEFRHKHKNLNVSSEFDIAFDNFLSSLQDINPK